MISSMTCGGGVSGLAGLGQRGDQRGRQTLRLQSLARPEGADGDIPVLALCIDDRDLDVGEQDGELAGAVLPVPGPNLAGLRHDGCASM